jgi:hypothetical protein
MCQQCWILFRTGGSSELVTLRPRRGPSPSQRLSDTDCRAQWPGRRDLRVPVTLSPQIVPRLSRARRAGPHRSVAVTPSRPRSDVTVDSRLSLAGDHHDHDGRGVGDTSVSHESLAAGALTSHDRTRASNRLDSATRTRMMIRR